MCENAKVVAIAAERLGPACAPMVCTDGMPTESQRCLLTRLAQAGARLRYHGDFDWPGLRIANYVPRTFGALPWRMSVADYVGRSGRSLEGPPVAAEWDCALRDAMLEGGYVLEEESVAELLLNELAGEPTADTPP